MRTCSGLEPSSEAMVCLMLSTLMVDLTRSPLVLPVSLVSMAKIAAPLGSPMNRIPRGPKARGPADLRSGLPGCSPFVASALRAGAIIARAVAIARVIFNCIGRSFCQGNNQDRVAAFPYEYDGRRARVNESSGAGGSRSRRSEVAISYAASEAAGGGDTYNSWDARLAGRFGTHESAGKGHLHGAHAAFDSGSSVVEYGRRRCCCRCSGPFPGLQPHGATAVGGRIGRRAS